jgi:hypothetical protein
MPNTTRTMPITTRTRFALLALGAISLCGAMALPAMAGDDAPDAGTNNPSNCRDLVNHKCLTKPRDDQSGRNQDTRNQANAAARRSEDAALANKPGPNDINKYKYGRDDAVFGPGPGWSVDSRGYYRPYNPFPNKGGVKTKSGSGGNGGAAGHTGSRIAGTRTSATAATPKSTTIDKATNTTTRDYRTGATAAPGGPPPAAAIGSKPTAEQVAAQSGTRDHRHK